MLANGTLVIASKCSHPDLFYSVRGGGGGVAGVVTGCTVKSHRSPEFTAFAEFSGTATSKTDYIRLLTAVLQTAAMTKGNASLLCNDGSITWEMSNSNGGSAGLRCTAYEGDPVAMKALLAPLAEWSSTAGSSIAGQVSAGIGWNASSKKINWMEKV